MKCRNNPLLCAWYITAVAIFSILGLLGYWLLFPYKTIDIEVEKIMTPHVERGQHLRYAVDWCKHIDNPAILSRKFEDGIIYHVPETRSDVPKGCVDGKIISVYVPKALPPGEYILEVIITYQLNPIREASVQYRTPTFTVH